MDNTYNIIEIIEDKYVLNTELLRSALNSTENYDNIALISIVGPKNHGKSFFMNFFIDYLNCENKNDWPIIETIKI